VKKPTATPAPAPAKPKGEPAPKADAAPKAAPAPAKETADTKASAKASGKAKDAGKTTGKPTKKGLGGTKSRIDEEFLIEGKLEKPNAYYILRRSSVDFDWARLGATFSPLVLESVQDPLF
jgi:hypothetical protein